MKTNMGMAAGLGLLSLGALSCGAAKAFDIDVDIGDHHRPPPRTVIVQQQPTVARIWVPDTVIKKQETVLVEPARVVKQEQQVLVEPSRVEVRKERVLVSDAHVEKQWVSDTKVDASLRIGPVKIEHKDRDGHWENVMVPAQYQIVEKTYTAPARYQTVVKEIALPARYETVMRDVVIPGHWEDTVVTSPRTVIVTPPPRHDDGLRIDLDLHKDRDHDKDKRKNDKDRDRDHDRDRNDH